YPGRDLYQSAIPAFRPDARRDHTAVGPSAHWLYQGCLHQYRAIAVDHESLRRRDPGVFRLRPYPGRGDADRRGWLDGGAGLPRAAPERRALSSLQGATLGRSAGAAAAAVAPQRSVRALQSGGMHQGRPCDSGLSSRRSRAAAVSPHRRRAEGRRGGVAGPWMSVLRVARDNASLVIPGREQSERTRIHWAAMIAVGWIPRCAIAHLRLAPGGRAPE